MKTSARLCPAAALEDAAAGGVRAQPGSGHPVEPLHRPGLAERPVPGPIHIVLDPPPEGLPGIDHAVYI